MYAPLYFYLSCQLVQSSQLSNFSFPHNGRRFEYNTLDISLMKRNRKDRRVCLVLAVRLVEKSFSIEGDLYSFFPQSPYYATLCISCALTLVLPSLVMVEVLWCHLGEKFRTHCQALQ